MSLKLILFELEFQGLFEEYIVRSYQDHFSVAFLYVGDAI